MAVLDITVNEIIGIFKENLKFPDLLKDIEYKDNLLLVTFQKKVLGMSPEFKLNLKIKLSFLNGVIEVNYEPENKISKFIDLAGVLDLSIDKLIQNVEFVKREKNNLILDINRFLAEKIKGIEVKDIEMEDGNIKIMF